MVEIKKIGTLWDALGHYCPKLPKTYRSSLHCYVIVLEA